MSRAVLFDLDGVLRLFDPVATTVVEEQHGLTPGTLVAAAFDEGVLTRLTTGRLTKRAWLDHLGEVVGDPAAVRAWADQPVTVDHEVLALARRLRDADARTAILTNGTDETLPEITPLGLPSEFDAVVNSADLGVAKPDAEIYRLAADVVGVPVDRTLLVDDSATNVAGARATGLRAHLHTGAAALEVVLSGEGLLP